MDEVIKYTREELEALGWTIASAAVGSPVNATVTVNNARQIVIDFDADVVLNVGQTLNVHFASDMVAVTNKDIYVL